MWYDVNGSEVGVCVMAYTHVPPLSSLLGISQRTTG